MHIGSAVAKVVVRCPEGYHSSEVSLQVIPEVTSTATIFLGMDWLLTYLTATRFLKGMMCFAVKSLTLSFVLGSRLSSIDLSGLNDLHSTLSVPMSPLFFWSLSPLEKARTLLEHGILDTTTCTDYPRFSVLFLEHMFAGMCTGEQGTACVQFSAICKQFGVRPSVLSLAVMIVPDSMAIKPQLIVDEIGAAFGVDIVDVDRTLELLTGRMDALRHLPYDNHSSYDICSPYMLCLFSHFERFKHEELIAVANAHGVTFVNDLPLEKIRAAVSDHVFSLRCVSNMKRPLLQIAPGCLEVLAEI